MVHIGHSVFRGLWETSGAVRPRGCFPGTDASLAQIWELIRPMKLVRLGLSVLASIGLLTAGASAQGYLPAGDDVHERIFEISPLAGWTELDGNLDYTGGGPLFGLRGTMHNSEWWSFEAQVAYAPGLTRELRLGMLNSYNAYPVYNSQDQFSGIIVTEMDTEEFVEESDSDLLTLGGSLLFHLSKRKLRPFVSLGGGFIDDLGNTENDPRGAFSQGYFDLGVGVKWYRESGWGWRVDVRDVMAKRNDAPREAPNAALVAAQVDALTFGGNDGVFFQEPYSPVTYNGRRWTHNIGVTVSVSMPFGFVWKDEDADGVETRFDDCPTTAPGVVVDLKGCGVDSDEDGVFDGLDECEGTPLGAIVDLSGCPSDIDGDGVFDGIDVDDSTPLGALVDERGQHYDTDKDGILDGLDKCNDTPLGANVDEDGCTDDPVEAALLAGEILPIDNVRFEGGGSELDPLSFHYVNRRAYIIERWTGNFERPLRIEIAVYSEDRALSQRRADAIRMYYLENNFGIGANNLVAVGYGPDGGGSRAHVRMTGEGDPPVEWDFGLGDGLGEGPGDDVGDVPLDVEDIEVPDAPEMPSLPDFPEDDGF